MSLAARIASQSARLSADGTKIILGPGPSEWSEFCQSLPRARWNQVACCWTCDFTPAAASRISFEMSERGIAPQGRLAETAASFAHALRIANTGAYIGEPVSMRTDGWHHQLQAFSFASPLMAALLAMDMGCGKTWDAIALMLAWNCQTILILCPLSVRNVWRREIEKHAGIKMHVVILEKGDTKAKLAFAKRGLDLARISEQPLALIVNYDTAKLQPFADWSLQQQWDCVIADESHRIKAHNSAVSKYAAKLFYVSKRRLCLTGTPLGQSPLDLFGQFRFLDPGLFGTSWHHFSNRYAVRGNPSVPQAITGYKNQEELQQRFHLITYRCKASDVLDLPEAIDEERTFTLCPAARKLYRELEEEMITYVGQGVVTPANALVKSLRLRQLVAGFLTEEETEILHRVDDGRKQLLSDILEDAEGEPVVVCCEFTPDLEVVRSLCEDLGRKYGELSGDRKDGLNDRAEMAEDIDVLGLQIQSGGLGVDTTRARIWVYYDLGWSLLNYEQSRKRIHRPGQTRNVLYLHLVCEGSVDRTVYRALRARKDIIEAVLEEYRSESP